MSSTARNEQVSGPAPDEDLTEALPADIPAPVLRQLAGEAAPSAADDGPVPAARPASLPLSPGQQRLWYLHEINPASIEYNMQLPLRLAGKLDAAALGRALNGVAGRHESLRTVIEPGTGRGAQVIRPPSDVQVATVDLSLAEDPGEALRRCLTQDAQRPFDLRNGPLLRAMLARLGPTEHVLVLSVHHIVSDGWSMGILMDELRTRYAAEVRGAAPDLPDLAVQYADYAIWQQEQTSAAALDAQLGYWRRQLTGLEPLDLPSDLPRPPVRTGVGEAWEFEIPQETTAGLRRIARDHSATLFMTLVAAVQVLLARYSGADDIAVATAVSGRTHVKLENLIGFFVNRIVLRAHVDQSLPFGDFLDAVRRTVLDAFANQEVPFQRIVEAVRAERDPSRPPLASVTVHLHGARQQRADAGGLLMEELTPPMVVNANDLSFDFREQDGQLTAMLGYTTDLFTADTARGMAEALTTLLAGIAGRPGQQLADLPILESEKAARLTENTAGAGPAPQTVTEMFAAQVALAPGGAAVACGEQVLSYAELDARAGRVAQLLVGRGVGPEDIVAVAVPRSAEMIVALLAVLKAGAAYLPLDLGQPDQRLEFMIEDSRPVLALTTRAAASRLTPWLPTVVLDGDPATGDEAGATAGRGRVASRPGQLAYVIYTSGSTGRPKAVLVSHVGVRQMVSAQARQLATGPGTRVLQFASLGFDAAFWEIGMSLLSGGTLVMPATQEPPTGEDLARLIADHRITHLTLPPTVLATLPPAAASTVTALTVAGEACPPGLVRDWAGGRRMVNAYGPTECTVCATMSDPLDADAGARGSVPIGRALAGAGVYLLDPRLRPVPVGVPGDLYISGNGLARGYLGRPGGTAERFVADPYGAPGTRMYRSGDVARWRPGGVLEFLGRADSQVKLRGFRIELGEVEAVLSDHPDVASAAADIRRSPSGGDQLAVYLTARGAAELTVARLRDYARQRLPEHMVPAVFTVLRELPLTSSGKVDRRALPDPVAGTGEDAGYIAPRTEAERILAETWSDLLGVERVGMNDNFFDLGGDSILGLEVVARARDKGLRVIPPHLLTRQTVAELAAEATLADPKAAEQPKDQPAAGGVALLPVHRWFFENLADSVRQFNQSVFVELTADPDYQALRAAARALLDQHDALRLRAEQVNGQWRESTASLDADIVSRVDLSGLVGDAREEQVRRAVAAAQRDFPLARGPLARILLIDAGDGLPARLFIAVHHLAMDGVSWRILLSDLQRAYEQAVAGQEIRLPQRTTTFREWARRFSGYVAEGGFDAELDYWTAAERDAATPLPVDGPGPNSAASRRVVSVRLPAARTTVLLHEVPDAYRTGVTEALLSALSRVLADWTGQDRVGIAVEGHGRADLFEDADLSRTVGWFTALFPLALTVPASRDCGSLRRSRWEALDIRPHHYTKTQPAPPWPVAARRRAARSLRRAPPLAAHHREGRQSR
jgi:amino acid adenylation domain-containing protein